MAGAYLQVGQQLVHLDARRGSRIQAGQRVGEGEDEGEGEVRYARR